MKNEGTEVAGSTPGSGRKRTASEAFSNASSLPTASPAWESKTSTYKKTRKPCPICGEVKDRMPPKSPYCYEHKQADENAIDGSVWQDNEEVKDIRDQIDAGTLLEEDRPPPPKRAKYVKWCRDNDQEALKTLLISLIHATGDPRGRGKRATGFFDFARYFEALYKKSEVVEGTKKIRMTNDAFTKFRKDTFNKTWQQAQDDWARMLLDPTVLKDAKLDETLCAVEVEDFILE